MSALGWLTLLLCWALRPSSWRAPAGWYINGVRPDGRFEARPVLGRPEQDLEDAWARREIRDDRALAGRIWCRAPATPRQDGLRVWCAGGRQ